MWANTAFGPIDYLEWGAAGGVAVVLLHHGFGSATSLAPLAKALAERAPERRFIAYSRPGCGETPPLHKQRPADYLEQEAARVLPAFLDALEIGQAHVIGHSDGGTIALLAAADHPNRILSVSAIAPHVIFEDITEQGVRAIAARDAEPAFIAKLARQHADPVYAYQGWRDHWLRPEMRN